MLLLVGVGSVARYVEPSVAPVGGLAVAALEPPKQAQQFRQQRVPVLPVVADGWGSELPCRACHP